MKKIKNWKENDCKQGDRETKGQSRSTGVKTKLISKNTTHMKTNRKRRFQEIYLE